MTNVFENKPLHILFASIPDHTEQAYWDQQNGGLSYHKGITCSEDGNFLIIEQRQWVEQESYGYMITKEEALKEIILSGSLHLLNHPHFLDLKVLYEKTRNSL